MQKSKTSIFDAAFWRTMLPLAIPIALQNLLMTSFRLVDTLMIGRLGDVSIAAVGLAGYASFFVELLTFGVASGSAVFLAQYHGAGNIKGIRRSFGSMMIFVVPMGLAITLLTMLFPGVVMRIFTDDPILVAEGASYLKFAALSYVSLTLNTVLGITLRCTENVKIPMYVSGFCAILNAVLNYVFIFGVGAVTAMGVAGAGLATAISSLMSPLLLVLISAMQKNVLIMPVKDMFDIGRGFQKVFWKRVLPVLLNEALWSLSIIGVNMVFGRMGTDNYAALTVERTIENIVFVFFVGLCNACNVLVGKSIGAGRIEDGKAYATRFVKLVPVFGLVLGALVALLRYPLVSLFDISDTAAHTARIMLLIYALDISIRNIPYMTVVGIFRAGGDTKFGLLCDAGVMYAAVLPATVLCGLVWKLPFLTTYIVTICVDDLCKLLLTVPHFLRMKWIMPVEQNAADFIIEGELLGSEEDALQTSLE